MPVHVFLNERSCESVSTPADVAAAMEEFIHMLRGIRERRQLTLTTRSPLPTCELARGYHYQQWAADGRNRDRHRFILALRNRSPYSSVLSERDADLVECRHGNDVVEGIGAAHFLDGLAASLPLVTRWSGSWLDVLVRRLAETPAGELSMEESSERVRHCARVGDLAPHDEWMRSSGRGEISLGSDLWSGRGDFFPHLDFLPRVAGDLDRLDYGWVVPVCRLLLLLEASVAGWDRVSRFPVWQTPHITPDSDTRKNLCVFEDLDGAPRRFDLHGRFTPGAGRIHFRLVREKEMKPLRVAYIGRKL